jgi:exosortase A-associated hydrolase 1
MTHTGEIPVVFSCAGEQLVGIVHPVVAARIGVVIVVGGPQYRVGSHRQFVLMARDLAQAGYPVFRFDYRGMGDSSGEARGFEHAADDIRAAIDAFAAAAPGLSGFVLWGLCDAASACLMYCAGDARVRGVIIANPWVRTEAGEARSYLRHYYLQRLTQPSFWRKVLKGEFRAGQSLNQLSQTVRQSRTQAQGGPGFIERMRAGLQSFRGPVLCLMSERDLTAREFELLREQDRAWRRLMSRRAVTTVALPGTDHTFSSREALELVREKSIAWLAHLSPAQKAAS